VRRICHHCRQPVTLNSTELDEYGLNPEDELYQFNGCDKCLQTGYKGRTGIYEIIEVDEGLSTLIHDAGSQPTLEKYCRQFSASLRDDGMRLFKKGDTTLDEVLRVTRENGH
jgi:general secretion pathway protein E